MTATSVQLGAQPCQHIGDGRFGSDARVDLPITRRRDGIPGSIALAILIETGDHPIKQAHTIGPGPG